MLFSPVRGQYIWIGVITRKKSKPVCVCVFAEIKITGLGIILGFGLEGHKLGVYTCVCKRNIIGTKYSKRPNFNSFQEH